MASTVELIKERLGIVEVVGSYIKLEKAGINLKARCPFHNEKTPSFFVSPTRGSFYCFGCGEKGDMFSFVEKFEGVDFRGALKTLAERAGVPLVYEKTEDKSERDTLYTILEAATAYYEENLEKNKKALEYLHNRGLKDETILEFRLGYAVDDWRDLLSHLRERGYRDADIEKSGLIKKDEDGKAKDFYDRFRGRIMFPIQDTSGRIVAFSGRIFVETAQKEKEDGGAAKYINSPETVLFSKSKILFGYDKAKAGIRKWGFTILVEGQMDLLMSHQSGFRNTVALSGTALTKEHVALLDRLSNKLVLALDADPAGLRASGRSAALTLSMGMDVKVARLSEGKDPADLIKADPELWRKSIREASHIIDFYLEVLGKQGFDQRKMRLAVSEEVLPYVARIESGIDRAHFIRRVADALRLPESAVHEEVDKLRAEQPREVEVVVGPAKTEVLKIKRVDVMRDQLLGLIEAETIHKGNKFDLEEAKKKFMEIFGAKDFSNVLERDSLTPNVVFLGEDLYGARESLESEVGDLLLHLKYQKLKEQFEDTMYELHEKERQGKSEEAETLLNTCHMLSREIAKIDIELKK